MVKNTNTWRLYNMLLKSQWDNEEIKEDIKKKKLDTMKMKTQHSKIHEIQEKQLCVQKYLRKQEKLQINKLPYHLKELEKEE